MHLRKHQVMKLLYRLKHRNRYPVMQYLWMIAGLNSRKILVKSQQSRKIYKQYLISSKRYSIKGWDL